MIRPSGRKSSIYRFVRDFEGICDGLCPKTSKLTCCRGTQGVTCACRQKIYSKLRELCPVDFGKLDLEQYLSIMRNTQGERVDDLI